MCVRGEQTEKCQGLTYDWQFGLWFTVSKQFVRPQVVFKTPAVKHDRYNHVNNSEGHLRLCISKTCGVLNSTTISVHLSVYVEQHQTDVSILSDDWSMRAVSHTCPEASPPPQTASRPWPSALLESRERRQVFLILYYFTHCTFCILKSKGILFHLYQPRLNICRNFPCYLLGYYTRVRTSHPSFSRRQPKSKHVICSSQ